MAIKGLGDNLARPGSSRKWPEKLRKIKDGRQGRPQKLHPSGKEGIQRIADNLIGWKEEERLSRVVDHADLPAEALSLSSGAKAGLKGNDYNISPGGYRHTSDCSGNHGS